MRGIWSHRILESFWWNFTVTFAGQTQPVRRRVSSIVTVSTLVLSNNFSFKELRLNTIWFTPRIIFTEGRLRVLNVRTIIAPLSQTLFLSFNYSLCRLPR